MSQEDSQQLILDLYAWQTREEFQYTHVWQPNMLVMWDNRSVLHRAYGGYDGYDRELHRLTIAGSAASHCRKSGLSLDAVIPRCHPVVRDADFSRLRAS